VPTLEPKWPACGPLLPGLGEGGGSPRGDWWGTSSDARPEADVWGDKFEGDNIWNPPPKGGNRCQGDNPSRGTLRSYIGTLCSALVTPCINALTRQACVHVLRTRAANHFCSHESREWSRIGEVGITRDWRLYAAARADAQRHRHGVRRIRPMTDQPANRCRPCRCQPAKRRQRF
jgi:hypothetical protein